MCSALYVIAHSVDVVHLLVDVSSACDVQSGTVNRQSFVMSKSREVEVIWAGSAGKHEM